MKNFPFLMLLVLLASCSQKPTEIQRKTSLKPSNTLHTDSLKKSFPVRIENSTGEIVISGFRTFKDKLLVDSYFTITLLNIDHYSIFKTIKASNIFEPNELQKEMDSVKGEFLDSAILKSLEFRSIRSNTLYFNAILENPKEGKEIKGRFNLFYRTKKKGILYGWQRDEINNTNHIQDIELPEKLKSIPLGIEVKHSKTNVYAEFNEKDPEKFGKYKWHFETNLRSPNENLKIIEFGTYLRKGNKWEFAFIYDRPFNSEEFAKWYSCDDAILKKGGNSF